ncbi:hypothetical protein J3458_003228 [Metarhizium acridum]|uniref:uncharacterized protein n=1 Tax=Metarhizium acridum TaxID=92637 RepID=UPI001C6CD208|nr:hypothetical protein J3458_003228 [Metarhizium acridum]
MMPTLGSRASTSSTLSPPSSPCRSTPPSLQTVPSRLILTPLSATLPSAMFLVLDLLSSSIFPAPTPTSSRLSTSAKKFKSPTRDAFVEFNKAFFQNETLRVAIHGKTKVKPAGLSKKYDVDFYKVVTFKGLNKLNGTTLSDMKIKIGTAEDGIPNFNATATLTNPSYYTIDIGNATFNNFADNQLLGNLTINNLVLKPGQNAVPVSAILDQTIIISAATKKPYCETGKITVELQGTHVRQGTNEIPWLMDALGSANQTVELSLAETFKAAGLGDFKATCSS